MKLVRGGASMGGSIGGGPYLLDSGFFGVGCLVEDAQATESSLGGVVRSGKRLLGEKVTESEGEEGFKLSHGGRCERVILTT